MAAKIKKDREAKAEMALAAELEAEMGLPPTPVAPPMEVAATDEDASGSGETSVSRAQSRAAARKASRKERARPPSGRPPPTPSEEEAQLYAPNYKATGGLKGGAAAPSMAV